MSSPRVSGVRIDQTVQQAREPVFWLNGDLKLVWVNRAWEELTGHGADSVIGMVCRAHGPSTSGGLPALGGSFYPPPEALAGRPSSTRTLIVHASGERRWRRVEFWPFHNEKGELSVLLGLVREPEEPAVAIESDAHRLRVELMEARERLLARHGIDALIGRGPAHRRLLEQIKAAPASSAPVLIVGEAGTGKRLVARLIHELSPRPPAPLVLLDTSALPVEALERELFGQHGDTHGHDRLSLPEGATLLLGDALSLPRDLQTRLVHTLDGNVRLIATSITDPDEARAAERLRSDLYYALTTFVIKLSPLRERLDELELLAEHFLERANQRGGRQRSGFSAEALRALMAYDWPGNLHELARIINDAHGRGDRDTIDLIDLPAAICGNLGAAYLPPTAPPTIAPLDELLTQVERRLIESALARARHNKSRAADLLGISRPRLYRRIKELEIPDDDENGDESAIHNESRGPSSILATPRNSPDEVST